MHEMKAMTIRLDATLATELAAVAEADRMSISDAVRAAVADRIERRRQDPEFRQEIRAMLARNQEILQKLAET